MPKSKERKKRRRINLRIKEDRQEKNMPQNEEIRKEEEYAAE